MAAEESSEICLDAMNIELISLFYPILNFSQDTVYMSCKNLQKYIKTLIQPI
jgi:hypothetical protein